MEKKSPVSQNTLDARSLYLIIYNAICASLWVLIFGNVASTILTKGAAVVYPAVKDMVLLTQSLAAIEILHSLSGIVRSPVLTNFVQVAGRCTVLWVVIEAYPSAAESPLYACMLLAWSAADVIRYLYFATTLAGFPSRMLVWLRYSAFYVLYPVGIASEMAEVYLAVCEAFATGHQGHAWGYVAAATLYIPAAPTLFNHMRRQRRKAI